MAISDRLNKLTTDITNAYASIENKGGTIPANKNTDSLATAIDSIEVIEQATAEGESLSLTNTKAMPYSDYAVKGKSEQEGEPSPSIPSEIHSVADDDINLLNINDFPISSNVSKEIKNNHLILTATGTSGAQVVATYVKNVDSSKNYTLSFKAKKIVKGTDGGPYIRVALYGSNDDSSYSLFRYIDNTNPTQGQEYSFTSTFTGYKYYRIYFYNNTSTPVTIGEKTDYYDIKFQEGSVATPYSPYNQGTVTIKQRVKNLLNVESIFTLKGSNTIDLDLEAGSYTLSLSNWSTTGANVMSQITFNYIDGTTLNVTIWAETRISSLTFTKKVTSVKIFSNTTDGNSGAITTTYTNLMLVKGQYTEQTLPPYEPYQGYEKVLQTEPLRSLPNGVKDTIEAEQHRKIGRQTGTLSQTTTITLSDAKTNGAYMCNIKPSGTLTGKTIELEAGDYEIIYELAEEIIEPLTQNQATTMLDIIKTGSYEGTTNIYTDEDVKPTIGVGYYKKS